MEKKREEKIEKENQQIHQNKKNVCLLLSFSELFILYKLAFGEGERIALYTDRFKKTLK